MERIQLGQGVTRKLFSVKEIFFNLIGWAKIHALVHALVKTQPMVYLRFVHFIIYKFLPRKGKKPYTNIEL